LEGRSRDYFPGLRSDIARIEGKRGLCYYVTVELRHYDSRCVRILFAADRSPDSPLILIDGPTTSPHRYPDFGRKRLCIWHPDDPRESRWTQEDGLVSLLALIKLHLFREAWWRDTGCGEWLGPQAGHADAKGIGSE